MTDVGNEDALSHPLVPEEPLEPTIKYDKRENTISIEIEQKEQSPLLGKALINNVFFSDSLLESQNLLRRYNKYFFVYICVCFLSVCFPACKQHFSTRYYTQQSLSIQIWREG